MDFPVCPTKQAGKPVLQEKIYLEDYKAALLQAFAQRVQQTHPDLVTAEGAIGEWLSRAFLP